MYEAIRYLWKRNRFLKKPPENSGGFFTWFLRDDYFTGVTEHSTLPLTGALPSRTAFLCLKKSMAT